MNAFRLLPAPLVTLKAVVAATLTGAFVHYVLEFPGSTSVLIGIVVAIAAVRWREQPDSDPR